MNSSNLEQVLCRQGTKKTGQGLRCKTIPDTSTLTRSPWWPLVLRLSVPGHPVLHQRCLSNIMR